MEEKVSPAVNPIGAFFRARTAAVRHIWKALSVSFINQAVSSGTNFLLALFFVRFMDVDDFGVYGIAIAAVLLFSGVGNALFLTQMVVHLPDKALPERPAYLGRNLVMVSGLALVALVIAAGIPMAEGAWYGQARNASVLLAGGAAAAAYLIKDYFLRIAYSLRREVTALAINLAVALATVSALGLVWLSGYELSAAAAIEIYALGQVTGVVMGLLACWGAFRIRGSGRLSGDLRESFKGGRWALGGVLVTWLQSQAYVYMTAAFVGPIGVGYANAARVFVSPLQLIMPAINQVTMPRLASLRSEGAASVANAGRGVTGMVLLVASIYVCLLMLLYPVVVNLLLADKYQGLGTLVAAWCVVVLMQLVRDGASTILQTLREFRRLTVSGTAIACLSVPIAAVASKTFGAIGAVAATAAAELALSIVLWSWIKRHVK